MRWASVKCSRYYNYDNFDCEIIDDSNPPSLLDFAAFAHQMSSKNMIIYWLILSTDKC